MLVLHHQLLDKFTSQFILPDNWCVTVGHFAKEITTSALAIYAPTITGAIVLSHLIAPSAAEAMYEIFSGVPDALKSLCAGLDNCIEGWVGEKNGTVANQFSSIFNATAKGIHTAKKCATINRIGETILNTFSEFSNNEASIGSCIVDAKIQFATAVEVSNVGNETCKVLQNNIKHSLEVCFQQISQSGQKNNTIIVCVLVGMSCFFAIAATCYALKRTRDMRWAPC